MSRKDESRRLSSLFSDRLGSLSKDSEGPSPKKEEKIIDDVLGAPFIQRCVIIQKDEKGYGLTVSGENPVFVESVKENGAAARVGVKEGDRIIKVNGSMVANCNHKDVVRLIKSGTYVALTLVGRPPGHSRRESGDQSFLSRPSPASPADRIHVGGPQPADPEKDQEFNRQKLRTIQMMYEQEKEHYEHLKTEHTKNPTEKSQSQLNDGVKTLKKLEEQLQYLQGTSSSSSSSSTDTISGSLGMEKSQFSFSREMSTTPTEETAQLPFTKQGSGNSPPADGHLFTQLGSMDEGVDTTSGSEAGTPAPWTPRHEKTGSMPEPIYVSDEALNSRDAAIPRSVSDVGTSSKHQKLVGSDSCPHLAAGGVVLDKSRAHIYHNLLAIPAGDYISLKRAQITIRKTSLKTSSMPTSIYDSGSLSDSNSPQHSPAPSPIPVQRGFDYVEPSEVHEEMATIHEPVTVSTVLSFTPIEFSTMAPTIDCITLRRAQITVRKPTLKPSLKPSVAEISPVMPDHEVTSPSTRLSQPSQQIMTIDDDDFSSEEEHQFDDHGPFAHIASLKNKPAHLAVFLHYLISNSDPSPMFFHLVTESYTQGNLKEMRKWAYEIHSTFLVEKAPLKVSIDEDIVSNIDNVLQYKYEKEDQLKAVFTTARMRVHNQVNELLQDFRTKRSLGLGSLYGDHDLQDDLDRTAELKIVDKYLTPHLERLLDTEEHTDRNLAMTLAITTFLKQVGVQRTPNNSRFLERCSSFIEKDKKMFRFKGSRKSLSTRKEIHYIKGHSLQAQHYHVTTHCNLCTGVLWGVGNQGFQCNNCDQNYHKLCVEKLEKLPEEMCSGAGSKKKDKKQRQSMLDRIIPRKPSANNPAARNDTNHQNVKDALKIHEGRDSDGGMMSPTIVSQHGGMFHHVQQIQEDDDEVEGEAKPSRPSRVVKLVERYQTMGGTDEKAGSRSPRSESPNSDDEKNDRMPVGRSESLKGRKEEKLSGSVRRTKSDVASDDSSVMKALDQSEASSSSSSLSAKSESPSTSREALQPLSLSHEDDSDFEVEDELPQLDAILSSHVLRKLKPKEKKRQEVINELFYTERSHVRNLKVLDRLFFRPWHNEPSLPHDLVRLLFPNLDELIELHKSMNDSMKKEAPGPGDTYGDVGDILLNGLQGANGEKICQASATFCQNQSFSLEMLKSRRLKDQKLAEFLREAESRKDLCRRLKLADLIPAQFQRLTKYKLLIENLLKYTQANTEEYNKLGEAVHCSKNVLNTVNKAVMDAENKHKIIEIQKRMDRRPIDNSSDPNVAKIKGISLVAVEFYKTGVKIWTEYLHDNGKLRLALQGEGPCNMIAQTPTLWMEPALDADHPDMASGNFFVELEKESDKDKLVLASLSSVSDDSYTLDTDEGEKTIPKNDPRLHPVGYSFASGTDRVLCLSPKIEKGSNAAGPTSTRTKRKRLNSKSSVPHVSCIESLNRLIDDKPYKALPMWFFSPEQRAGWEPSYCDLYHCRRWNASSEALLCAFTRSRAKHEEEVMDLIDAQHAGETVAAMLLMPRKIDQEMLTFQSKPLFQLEKNYQVLHLCTSRKEKSNIHLINAKGLALRKVHRTYVEAMIATQMFLGLGSRMELPGYDKILRIPKDVTLRDEQVVYYFNELLQSVTSVLMIYFVDCKLANRGENATVNEKLVHEFIEHKEKHLDWSDDATMCPAHILQTSYDPSRLENSPKLKPYIKFLKTVECNPSLENLPEDFFNSLQGLEEFSANKSHLLALPQGLDKCTHLTKLEFSGTNLTTLPEDMNQLKDRLLHLDISRTNIRTIPDVVFELVSLKTLIADNLHLATLSERLKNLSNLVHLSLKGAVLSALPKAITKLKMLERLELAGVPWLDVKPGHFVTEESFKEYLRSINDESGQLLADVVPSFNTLGSVIDEKEAGKLNAELFRVFTRFGFHGDYQPVEDRAGGFPPEIFELENLKYLDLSYQGIVFVPEDIGRLTKLETLLLNDNPYLTLLPGALGNLPLERLTIDDCPSLKTPPPEICSKGFMALMGYLRRLVAGSVTCKRTKLMMVGLGGAGKTSLVKALLSGENKCHIESGEAITDGIDIHPWTITRKNEAVTFSVWDFAGQTVYYNTHQFFLSNRAVYLLMWNIRLGYEHAGLDFWLSSIAVHSPQAPIIVVGTHLDQVSNYVIPQIELKKRYPQIVGFHFISTWSGKGVEALQEKLFSVSIQQKYMGEKIPEVWLKFEEKILSHRAKSDVVDYSDVETIATDSGIFDSLETSQAVRFLHDLGTVQHFDNQFLRDKVVVNPQWIVDVMACVVSVKDSPIKEGKFKHADIAKVWKDFPEEYHEWLLKLTEKFDLTFPLPEKALNLVPCLLPETEPEISWPSIDKKKGRRETKMEYKFEYLPVGLFNRGQVRLYEYSDSSFIWKRGSVLKKNGHVALITQTRDNKLMVKCQGPRPENILFMIHEVFETLIQESFQGVQYDFRVPCGDCMNIGREPYMFKGSTIRRATGLKTPFLQCVKNFHIISLTVLNGICPPDDSQDYDLHLRNTVQSLTDLRLDLSADIFISYCHRDLPSGDVKMVDPRNVQKNLEAAGYKCWFEESTGKYVLEERILALRDAKVFLCMISDNYVEDIECCNLFKFARTVLRKPMVIVTVGPQGGHTWKKSALGMLISDEIYINMQRVEHNEEKTRELLKTLSDRMSSSAKKQDNPPCFFSYCWRNSQRAVAQGQESVPGAVGFADPRELKDYLQNNGIDSWLDIERAGSVHGGLFDDIAEGLRDAKVMIACVSDQYATSDNCQMEFRFAAKSLNLPIIVAIVGTGQQWRATEVGMLSLNYDQINFQEPTQTGHEKLLQLVKTHVKPKAVDGREMKKKRKKDAENEDEKKASYQELFELAQRKFLRQISTYADIFELHPFPRLVILDFAEPEEVEEEKPASDDKDSAKPNEGASATAKPRTKPADDTVLLGSNASMDKSGDRDKDDSRERDKDHSSSVTRSKKKSRRRPQVTRRNTSTVQNMTFLRRKFCYRIMCENEQGWHIAGDPIPVSSHFGESQLTQYAPYLARILAVIKHSSKIQLNCVGRQQGEAFIKWLDETTMTHTSSDFKAAYQSLRRDAGKVDHEKSANNLARCLTTSGKVFWMCNSAEHDKSRMTVLTNTAASIPVPTDYSAAIENYMLNHMRPLKDWEQLAEKYLPKDVTSIMPDKSNEGKEGAEKPDRKSEVTDQQEQGLATMGSMVPPQSEKILAIEWNKEESITGSKKSGESITGTKTSPQGKTERKRKKKDSKAAPMGSSSSIRSVTTTENPVPSSSTETKAEGKERPEFHARHKFKAAGYAAQASVKAANYQKGSKACGIL